MKRRAFVKGAGFAIAATVSTTLAAPAIAREHHE
jgi:hypothetical protein